MNINPKDIDVNVVKLASFFFLIFLLFVIPCELSPDMIEVEKEKGRLMWKEVQYLMKQHCIIWQNPS
jgi:hypothetical protein